MYDLRVEPSDLSSDIYNRDKLCGLKTPRSRRLPVLLQTAGPQQTSGVHLNVEFV